MTLADLKYSHALKASSKLLAAKLIPQPTSPVPTPVPFMSNPTTILLIRSLIPAVKPCPIESVKSGKLSYMGQILHQLGLPTLGKDRSQVYLVSSIARIVPHAPFTFLCAGQVVQSDLTTNLINTPPENEARIRSLLEAAGFQVQFEDK